jgi:hypothetical protein
MENLIELKTKLEEELARVIKQMFDVWCLQYTMVYLMVGIGSNHKKM